MTRHVVALLISLLPTAAIAQTNVAAQAARSWRQQHERAIVGEFVALLWLATTQVMLFHVSEEGGIDQFEPRASEGGGGPVVWAIDAARLRNYLVPRECPRVTYYAGRETTSTDTERFLGSSTAVIAVERSWFERLRSYRLYCYHLPPHTFDCIDECAGYFVSRVPVVPVCVEVFDNPVAELQLRGVKLRILPNLWPLRDAVVASSLQFSIIRMRNAVPREARLC